MHRLPGVRGGVLLAENNIAISEENRVAEGRAKTWIRIERYWEGEFPNAKARFVPVLCQHCDNAGCEPVCPVWATYHNDEGLNVQVYNRCVGTRFCANGCIYSVRLLQLLGTRVAGAAGLPAESGCNCANEGHHRKVHVLRAANNPG